MNRLIKQSLSVARVNSRVCGGGGGSVDSEKFGPFNNVANKNINAVKVHKKIERHQIWQGTK